MNVNFQRGQFLAFKTLNKIHLGRYSFDLPAEAEVTFDGAVLRYNGQEFEAPQLRGLVGSWIAPMSDTAARYAAKPADVEVRASTSEGGVRQRVQMARASEEEAEVGSVAAAAARREQARVGQVPQAQRQVPQERVAAVRHQQVTQAPIPEAEPELEDALAIPEDEGQYRPATPTTAGGKEKVPLSEAEKRAVEEADARNRALIAQLATPVEKPKTFGGNRYDELDPTDQAPARGRAGKFAVVDVDGQEGVEIARYRFSDGAAVGAEGEAAANAKGFDASRAGKPPIQVGNAVATTPRVAPPKVASSGAQVIADPASIHEPQAARARSTTQIPAEGNVGIDQVFEGGATGDVAETMSGDELADILPDAEVAGRVREVQGGDKKFKVIQKTPDEEIAEITANWNVKRNWQKRVEEAVEYYGNWPEALEAIYAIESPAVIKQIKTRVGQG